jgi:hypothetical protein
MLWLLVIGLGTGLVGWWVTACAARHNGSLSKQCPSRKQTPSRIRAQGRRDRNYPKALGVPHNVALRPVRLIGPLSRLLRGNLRITLLRPWIVASHYSTNAVAEGDQPIRILGHQCLAKRASDLEPRCTLLLHRDVRFVRNSHVAAALLRCSGPEHRPLVKNDVVCSSHSPINDRIFGKCG